VLSNIDAQISRQSIIIGTEFKGAISRLRSWSNALAGVSKGYLEVMLKDNQLVVFYNLNFKHLFMLVSGMIIASLGSVALPIRGMSDGGEIAFKVALLVGAWLLLFGGNVAAAKSGFSSLVQRIISSIENSGINR
jgi:hypothetical protein